MSRAKGFSADLTGCWKPRIYEQHRQRVDSARSAIDYKSPKVRGHVSRNTKGMQLERERQARILKENFILLHKLQGIMHRKKPKEENPRVKWQESRCMRAR